MQKRRRTTERRPSLGNDIASKKASALITYVRASKKASDLRIAFKHDKWSADDSLCLENVYHMGARLSETKSDDGCLPMECIAEYMLSCLGIMQGLRVELREVTRIVNAEV